jgi:PhzF family phenazine biosynthesis protein
MTIPFFEVVAFADRLFTGNPAGVCLLDDWLPDAQMQAIAAENNLAETAFLIERAEHFDLRWMTPAIEVDLCGHATLASAHVIFRHLNYGREILRFETKSGELRVAQKEGRLVLDFPARPAEKTTAPNELSAGLGAEPAEVWRERDLYAIFESEAEVAALRPNFEVIAQLENQGVVATAPGRDCDFVSRYFAPRAGIPEDPVTGSTHCTLIPFWSERLDKRDLFARQISPRGGKLYCEDRGDRVAIGGDAVTYSEGKIHCLNDA